MRAYKIVLSQNDTDIVLTAAGIGSCDWCLACCRDIHAPLKNQFFDAMALDHIGQPISGKQQIVPGLLGGAR
jgi:hypothetical protein